MALPSLDKLPPKPRKHLAKIQLKKVEPQTLLQESLRLLYDTTIYMASIALSDYRAHVDAPDLDVERRLARRHLNLKGHIKLFRAAASMTDGTLCSLRDPEQMVFKSGPKLEAAMKAAKRVREVEGSRLRPHYEELCEDAPETFNLHQFFHVIQDLRNRGYGHLEESGFDAMKDFPEIVATLLRDAALELLSHPDVARVIEDWFPAEVVSDPHPGRPIEVRRFGEDVDAITVHGDVEGLERGSTVLVHDRPEGPELRGLFLALYDDPRPQPCVDEALTAAIDAQRYNDAVTATEEEFSNKDRTTVDASPEVVDDLLVMVLEDFKLTTAPLDVDVLVGRLDHLLDHHSPALPPRVIRDIDYFASLSAHARGYPLLAGETPTSLAELAWNGTRVQRGRAIATLGELGRKNMEISSELVRVVQEEPRSELRKHALLAIGRIGAPGAFDFLCDTARDHRRHPGVASYALRALSGRPTGDAVQFLADYLACDAPYACLNAAAWSLAKIFGAAPRLANPCVDVLLGHIETLSDPYTRGCLIFALAATGRRDLAGRIVDAVQSADAEPADPYVLEDACLAAGLLRDPVTLPFLVACSQPDQPDPVVRRQAILALHHLDTQDAREALDALPAADEQYVRRAQHLTEDPPAAVAPARAANRLRR